MRDEPPSPPIVAVGEEFTAYLLAWDLHEPTGECWAWVTWVRERNGEPYRHIVSVPAASLRPLEEPEAYRDVPRRILTAPGQVRPSEPGAAAAPSR
jgi:hypothetical protein